MAIFVCSKYPNLKINIEPSKFQMDQYGQMREIMGRSIQFNKGRLELDDEADKEIIEKLRKHSDFNVLFFEIEVPEEIIEREKKEAQKDLPQPKKSNRKDTKKEIEIKKEKKKEEVDELSPDAESLI